ncbi:MAG: DMT family transporter [Microbacteriaceae bacterium]|nr:DMT family transporter [Microbacteriaceae bacterium]MDR9444474.1 DMT family transporter [Microbacteriaceae bacterium]
MSTKGLTLFLLAGVIWGVPYFFTEFALASFSTPSIIWLRVTIGALVLIPLALRSGDLKKAIKYWPFVLAFAFIEMVGPWFLIPEAQRSVSSGLASLIITTVPFFGILIVGLRGDKTVWHPKTLLGLILGGIGVIGLVGIDVLRDNLELLPIGMLLLAALGYAIAPIIVSDKLRDVPMFAVIALSLAMVSVIYAVPAWVTLPTEIPEASLESWIGVLSLGVLTTAVAFVVFFTLVKEIGPARAELIVFVNVAVAVLLGIVVLGEPFTIGMMFGFPLIIFGSYLAIKQRQQYIRKSKRTLQ